MLVCFQYLQCRPISKVDLKEKIAISISRKKKRFLEAGCNSCNFYSLYGVPLIIFSRHIPDTGYDCC